MGKRQRYSFDDRENHVERESMKGRTIDDVVLPTDQNEETSLYGPLRLWNRVKILTQGDHTGHPLWTKEQTNKNVGLIGYIQIECVKKSVHKLMYYYKG